MLPVRIVGRAKIGEQMVSDTASTLPALQKLMPATPRFPAGLDDAIALGVGPPVAPFFEIAVDGGKITFPRAAGAAKFKLTAKRLDKGFKAPITLAIEGLPAELSAEIKPIAADKTESEIEVKGPATIAEGTHTVRIVATGTHNNQTKRVVLADVPLEIKP
jgi:hypothetical protein